jgi:hypothetical protein
VLDLRAVVRARMVTLELDQAALARLVAPRWGAGRGIAPDSAVHRLSRWFSTNPKTCRDITSDDLAILLDVLGLDVTPRD